MKKSVVGSLHELSGWMGNQRGVLCVEVFYVSWNVNLPRALLFGLVGDAVSRHEFVEHHDSDEHVHLRHVESLIRFHQQHTDKGAINEKKKNSL